jgi:hypothetical protein
MAATKSSSVVHFSTVRTSPQNVSPPLVTTTTPGAVSSDACCAASVAALPREGALSSRST